MSQYLCIQFILRTGRRKRHSHLPSSIVHIEQTASLNETVKCVNLPVLFNIRFCREDNVGIYEQVFALRHQGKTVSSAVAHPSAVYISS